MGFVRVGRACVCAIGTTGFGGQRVRERDPVDCPGIF